MNISHLKNRKQRGEVATLFTVAALVLMAAGTLLGSARIVQDNVLKLGGFAYDRTYRAHFYTGPTFQDKDTTPGQPNSGYTLIRGSLCFTGATIPSQLQQFWVHTPQDPNQGYPQKACDNTNADTKDDCIVYEGRTVKYIAPQTSRPYCDSPDVGKKNWRAWDFTLKLQAPYTSALCSGLFVSSSSSFVSRDPIEIDMNVWRDFLKSKGVDCGPTPTVVPSENPTAVPSVAATNTPTPSIVIPTAKPTIDNRLSPWPTARISIRPTDRPRCPDPKRPCPSITPVQDCRNDIQCSNANPCPIGYVCLTNRADPLGRGICASKNPKCNPSATPTPPQVTVSPPVTDAPQQAKIRGEIVVNSCKKPDAVSTIICEKNNPTHCMDVATTVSFVGQDPANPNKWVYTYEHLQAPSASGGLEPVVKNALYENMQVFAQYTSAGLIREAGRVGFPPSQLGNLRAYATIPSSQTEAVVNYEVPQNSIVCPPVSPSPVPPTVIPSPMACNYEATAVVVDEATITTANPTGNPIPLSQMGDLNKWGLANDKQPTKPTTLFKNYGEVINGERTSKYTFKTDRLTFRDGTPPDPNALYNKGDKAQVNLYIDTNKWQIVKKLPCNGKGCPIPNEPVTGRNLDEYGSPTNGFDFNCDTKVERYTWVVKKLPDGNPGQCVMRDATNAQRCTPKNVQVKLKSSSRVEVSWTAPDSSCPFNAGVGGDHYRIDIVDDNTVIKTCTNISKTKAECRLDKSYNNNNGDFIRGRSYDANVYAVKEIPGATDLCIGNNGTKEFSRDAKNNGGDGDNPEPTGKPVGGDVLTRQLDWMSNGQGVCWAAWSHGDCRLAYNGSKKWVVSTTDRRFMCLSEEGSNKVVVGLMKGQSEAQVTSKKVDCFGNTSNACNVAKGTNISQCESDLSNATTYNGPSRLLKQGECWELDESLGEKKVACPSGDPIDLSKQPAPRKPGDPQPTTKPGNGGKSGNEKAGSGTVTIDSLDNVFVSAGSEKILYTYDSNHEMKVVKMKVLNDSTLSYEIPDFNQNEAYYTIEADIDYEAESNQGVVLRSMTAKRKVVKADFNKPGIWDLTVKLDPKNDPLASETTPPGENGSEPTANPGPAIFGIIQIKRAHESTPTEISEGTMELNYLSSSDDFKPTGKSDINLEMSSWKVKYSVSNINQVKVGDILAFRIMYSAAYKGGYQDFTYVASHIITSDDLKSLSNLNWTVTLDPIRDGPKTSSLLSTISLRNNSSSAIKSVSIAACDSSNKCSSNTVPLSLAAGASTKFKPTFSVASTTRRLSCVVNYANGTSKQCTPQLVTGSNGLQFSITTQSNNSVSTSVISPLKTADTNRDCKVTSADATGLRDLDGNGSVNAADTSLFFSFIGQNACK